MSEKEFSQIVGKIKGMLKPVATTTNDQA